MKESNVYRANGGHIFHLVLKGTREALCGFEPSGRRGRWVQNFDDHEANCPKCIKKKTEIEAKEKSERVSFSDAMDHQIPYGETW